MSECRRRPRVYIAGPISIGDIHHNIEQANRAFLALMRLGFAPLCPHWSCFAGGPRMTPGGSVYAIAERLPEGTTHADWIGIDLPWVQVADAMLRLPGESAGADAEVAEAELCGVEVFKARTAAEVPDLIDYMEAFFTNKGML